MPFPRAVNRPSFRALGLNSVSAIVFRPYVAYKRVVNPVGCESVISDTLLCSTEKAVNSVQLIITLVRANSGR